MTDRPKVLVLSTGGTISMTSAAPDAGAYPTLQASDLTSQVELEGSFSATIETRDVCTLPGPHLSFEHLRSLDGAIREAADRGFQGVVVTQGTDSIEETAFALDLVVGPSITSVVTGAMRTASQLGTDGPANIRDAAAVAADPACAGLGVLVVLAGAIHSAALVRKTNSFSPAAFESFPGCLGWVAENNPHLLLRPFATRNSPLNVDWDLLPQRVPLLPVGFAQDGWALQTMGQDIDGLVVDAMGAGHVTRELVEPLSRIARDRPVVLCSRTGSGPVLNRTYGFFGSEQDLRERGLIGSSHLDGRKARIALMVLLASRASRDEIVDFFSR